MTDAYFLIEQSGPLRGSVPLNGAKNAVLVIMALGSMLHMVRENIKSNG